MSQTNRIATSASVSIRHPKEIHTLLKDPTITISNTPFGLPTGDKGYAQKLNFTLYVKKPVIWKGAPERMLAGVREGLGKAVGLSKAWVDRPEALGTAIDPRTGWLIPRKGLKQREIRAQVRPLPPEEKRRRRRLYRAPGVVPLEALGITPVTVTPPAPPTPPA